MKHKQKPLSLLCEMNVVAKISLKWHMASLNLGQEHFCGHQSVKNMSEFTQSETLIVLEYGG